MKPRSKVLIAKEAIELFLQYRDGYGHDEDSAFAATLNEFSEAENICFVCSQEIATEKGAHGDNYCEKCYKKATCEKEHGF
jgi:hypothetical protein